MPERYTDDSDIGGVTYETDRHRIEAHVRQALTQAGVPGIDVVCIDGEVTLTGVVCDEAERRRTIETTRSVHGVRDVVDRLHVVP